MNEANVSEEQVREEHLKAVREPVQWAYLLSVIFGAFVLMVLLIALLGATSG